MADSDVWLGIDLGTQSVRTVTVTPDGQVVGQGSCALVRDWRDGPRHEQDPNEWWTATVDAICLALAGTSPRAVRGMAVDGTSGTIVLADKNGEPRTRGLMYDDARASHLTSEVNTAGAAVWQRLGYRMQASWALPKVAWLAREQPAILSNARLLTQADYIAWRLTGNQTAADSSNSLKTGYDLLQQRWPVEVFERLGIPTEILPDVVTPGALLGTIGSHAAEQTGLSCGTPVVAGMTDGCAAQLGAGAVAVGSWNSVLGTTLVLKGVTRNLIRDPNGIVYSHRAPDGTWLPGGASSSGAGVLTHRFRGRDLAALDRAAQDYEPATVITYPLASVGERFPFAAPQAEEFTVGSPASEADYFASLLQGVGFVERLSFDYLDSIGAPVDGELTFTGGGTKSRYWCQLRADILGRPARLPEQAEPAVGMALLAAASEHHNIAEMARRMIRVRETVTPRREQSERLIKPYLQFVGELVARNWISSETFQHCEQRTGRTTSP